MDKNEILSASRKENKNKDIYELQVQTKAQAIGGCAALVTSVFLYVITIDQIGHLAYGFYMIYLACIIGMTSYRAFIFKKKVDIICGIVLTLCFIWCLIRFSQALNGQ